MSVLSLGQAFGRVPRYWRAESVTLTPVIHEQRRENPAHAHEAALVLLMLDGEYVETAGRRSFRYDRFTTVYHPPAIEHHDIVGTPGVRLLMFEFTSGLLDGVDIRGADVRSVRDLSGTRTAWNLLSLYRDAASDCEELVFASRAMELIGEVVRATRSPRDLPALRRARDYLHAHFRDRLSMKQIADAAGLHPVYLGQLFHHEIGETIGNYVGRLRVHAAADRLCKTQTPIAMLAFDLGFFDQSHFQRIFKRVSGFTPAAFRQQFASRR